MSDNKKIDFDNVEIVNGEPRYKKSSSDNSTNNLESDISNSSNSIDLKSSNDNSSKESPYPTTPTKYAWLLRPNKFTIGLALFLAITLPVTSLILGYVYGKYLIDINNADNLNNVINKTNIAQIGNYKVALNNVKTTDDINVFKYVPQEKATGEGGYGNMFYGDKDMDSEFNYYNIGTITDGKYEDYKLVYGFPKSANYISGRFPIVLAYYNKDAEIIVFDTTTYKDQDGKDKPYKFIPNIFLQSKDVRDTDSSIYAYLSKSDLKVSKISVTSNDVAVYDLPDEQMIASIKDDNNNQVYTYNKDTDGAVYEKTQEGFYKAYYINPSFDTTRITWTKNDTKNTNTYTYKSIGGCFRYSIQAVNPDFELVETGKNTDGDSLFEPKDYKQDTFIKHLYDVDYIQDQVYLYNEDKADDKKPYTFDQFTKKHPVFYWKDPFNRYIRFVNNDYVFVGGCAKPAIYLYPTTQTNINVQLSVDGQLGFTNPKYNNGWNVTAKPDGTLTMGANTYDYLYWDGQFNQAIDRKDGFMIEANNLDNKLSNILSDLGFNNKEKSQFIEYWLPKMKDENKPYYFVTFVDEKVLDKVAPLTVSPKPESYKRYFMIFRGEDTYRKVPEMKVEKFVRNGFTLFEWGGAKDI